ncbi:hypothetical protein E2C01_098552 [Portunus trituberculatus]|uniref:Uncharacterized protein n=1 Tax=Portunus trituberculatus TaxID=210409 RepID=A0A5B7K398_PORTR|nr:hypothetical protein [Portunus trituberculatus]
MFKSHPILKVEMRPTMKENLKKRDSSLTQLKKNTRRLHYHRCHPSIQRIPSQRPSLHQEGRQESSRT